LATVCIFAGPTAGPKDKSYWGQGPFGAALQAALTGPKALEKPHVLMPYFGLFVSFNY
jgi:hypothetical protein